MIIQWISSHQRTLIYLSNMLLVAVVVKHNSQVIIHFHFFLFILSFFSFQLSSRSHEEKAGLELRSREASGYILSFFLTCMYYGSDLCGVSSSSIGHLVNFCCNVLRSHSMFLEWWNTTKSLSNIWQHFRAYLTRGLQKYARNSIPMMAFWGQTKAGQKNAARLAGLAVLS